MSDRFLRYLEDERRRLGEQLERARARGTNRAELERLAQLRAIVDDQLARWSSDLGADRLAA